jgi:hypothetical protein
MIGGQCSLCLTVCKASFTLQVPLFDKRSIILSDNLQSEAQSEDYSHITTVIFDMDGTLIEHTWQLEQITQALFGRFAKALAPVTHDQFFEMFWTKNEDMWYMMVDGVLDGDTAVKYSYVNTLRALAQDPDLAEQMTTYWCCKRPFRWKIRFPFWSV